MCPIQPPEIAFVDLHCLTDPVFRQSLFGCHPKAQSFCSISGGQPRKLLLGSRLPSNSHRQQSPKYGGQPSHHRTAQPESARPGQSRLNWQCLAPADPSLFPHLVYGQFPGDLPLYCLVVGNFLSLPVSWHHSRSGAKASRSALSHGQLTI